MTVDGIEKVADTDNQTVPTEARLPIPLAVITKASDGRALARVKVRWIAGAGGGQLSDSVTLSDGNGRAEVTFTTGRAVGAYEVRAQLVLKTSRSTDFSITAVAGPSIASVAPTQFTGGDLVTLQGSAFGPSPVVEIGGAPARVTSASATAISAVVPVCLAPGQAAIRVRVSGANSNTMNGVYVASTSPVNLGVGEYASIDPAQLAGCATFPAADVGGAEYLLAPQAASTSVGVSADYRLAGDAVLVTIYPPAPQPSPADPVREFHEFLRQRERALSLAPRPATPGGIAPAPAAASAPPQVGDQREFRVCNKLPCTELPDFTKVQAKAKYVGSHVAIFQDLNVPPGGFTDDEFGPLGQIFNDVLYDVDTRAFGVESDVDGNGIVYMLLTPVVNGLTQKSQCSSGVITGFFFAFDIDPAYSNDARFNQAEVFYGLVPDPQGTVTCTVAKTRINQIIPSTFIHEFQHMISYNQHVLQRRGLSEDIWLNEAMSHLAEELGGLKFKETGNDQTFSDFVIGDLYDAFLYLKAPGANYVLWDQGGGTLAERGGPWLFLRWVVDKFGPGVTRRLEETSLIGTENLANAIGEPVSRLLGQWFLANWVSDLPGFTAPARLRYDTWSFRTTFASLNQQQPSRFDRPYPLVPQQVVGGTFSATGTLKSGSGDYFRVTQGPSQGGFTVRLTSSAGGPIDTKVLARLNVIRVR
ncbi:MAG: IPT/TIG domain-containing protein [Gemmatimonadetes bacterium]|nr:IPT/TIG domain-containing protein [Gemmatimonadota bacterium]